MSSRTAADEPASTAPTLTDRLTWDQIAALSRDDAIAHTIYGYRRHRMPPAACWTLLLGTAALAALAAVATHPILGPLASTALIWVAVAYRTQADHDWALDQLEQAAPPTGRLHVLLLLLSYTRAGGCAPETFTRLLRHAPDELSCAALGRHMSGVCPHANISW